MNSHGILAECLCPCLPWYNPLSRIADGTYPTSPLCDNSKFKYNNKLTYPCNPIDFTLANYRHLMNAIMDQYYLLSEAEAMDRRRDLRGSNLIMNQYNQLLFGTLGTTLPTSRPATPS